MKKDIILDVTGMTCASCAQNIEKALAKQDFVSSASVNYANRKAYVTVDENTDEAEIIKTVKKAGYSAVVHNETGDNSANNEIKFAVQGMTCAACALNIEKLLKDMPGIIDPSVNYANKRASFKIDPEKADIKNIKRKVKKIGYGLTDIKSAAENEEEHLRNERKRLIAAWIITVPLTIKMILEMFFGIMVGNINVAFYLDLLLAFPVIFIIGFPVLKATWGALRHLAFNMDSLIGIGTLAAYSTGILKLFGIQIENFAVVGAMIMSINFIGNYLKETATGKASQAIKQLLELGAKNAHLLKSDGEEMLVKVEELKVGDIVIIRPGEKIPVDGVIINGETSIDESIATGESIPVDRKTGGKVIGATVNQQGTIKVRIEKTGRDTFLSQIIRMVEEAQGTKVPIQAFADKVTSYFVPFVLVVSFLTFLFWFFFPEAGRSMAAVFGSYIPWLDLNKSTVSLALFASIATLVIACPCALGLATPTAIMVGMGKGAMNGILIRNGEAIQASRQISTVVFDKTGTITAGKPVVSEYYTETAEVDFFKAAASIENQSEHPLAKSIVDKAKEKGITPADPQNFSALTGKGIRAEMNGKKYIVGSFRYFKELNISPDMYLQKIEEYQNKGYTVILVSADSIVTGIFGISDELKPDSLPAIRKLREMGIKTAMLTGDNEKSAKNIADRTGIDEVYSELLPQDKINIIKKLQDNGEIIAMVGDGINDAPALKQANVGIAIGTGTDIAIESADITLTSGSLTGVVKAIVLSRATFKKIMQNLFWAFFYNIIAIPLAVLGLLHPVVAEAAMALSSINVVGNSLRLKRVKLE